MSVNDLTVACLQDIEDVAFRKLPKKALDYYRSGADQMQTLQDNLDAFKKYRFLPRMLMDVSQRQLSTRALGCEVSMPIGIAPTAMQRMAYPYGETASVRAAQTSGCVFILSTISTCSIEQVAEAAPEAIKWFQLYIYKDRQLTASLVKRAEAAGFKALVLTVDAPYFGKRRPDIRNQFELPRHLNMANFSGQGDAESGASKSQGPTGSGINNYVASLFDQSLSWKDVSWLQSISPLPLILKGILHPDDARLAVQHGASGIIVSNHGARQLDGVPASIDALPAIVKAVAHTQCEVFVDGGFRCGSDVLKALALGAKMAFIGRPVIWGLSYSGQSGVELVLELIRKELDLSMALAGCTSVQHIPQDLLIMPGKCICGHN